MPRRIQLSRKKGTRLPKGAISVARPTRWGNPFKKGDANGLGWGTVRDNAHAAALFAKWLYVAPDLVIYERDRHAWMLAHLDDLRGRDLACWCAPDTECHAAVLLIIANSAEFAQKIRDDAQRANQPVPVNTIDGRKIIRALADVAEARRASEGGGNGRDPG